MRAVVLFILAIFFTTATVACSKPCQIIIVTATVEATPTVTPTVTPTPLPTSTSSPTITPSPMPTFALKNPTWNETIYFLDHDQVNLNEYAAGTEKQYICGDFACDVCLAAREQGLRCAYVHLNFSFPAHAIIAFEVVDQGIIYFEPQSDMQTRGEVGSQYFYGFATIESSHFYWNTEPNWFCEPDAIPFEMLELEGIQ